MSQAGTQMTQPFPPAAEVGPLTGRAPLPAVLFIGAFAVLLTSFPARNPDVWQHLAGGRELFRGGVSPTWLFDLAAYAVFSVSGGGGLAAVKAMLCGGIAVLMFRLGSVTGWRVSLAVTGLAVLAMSTRLLLQSQTASVGLLAVALWLVYRRRPAPAEGWWPGWELPLLFAVWANVDEWFVLGLVAVALIRLGQGFERRTTPRSELTLGRWAVSVGVMVAASCLSVSHFGGLRVPQDLRSAMAALQAPPAELVTVHSPFQANYFAVFRDSSAAHSYYPLVALGLISFLLNRRGWRWSSFLPWLALAAVSGLEARAIPFFAVLAGPVTAWNVQGFFARRAAPPPRRRWVRLTGYAAMSVVALAFLVAAWPGWLQGPPYEPRRWAVETPPAIERTADFLRRTHADEVWAPDTRTLHVSADTLGTLAWFCPEDPGLRNATAVERLLDLKHPEEARRQLRDLRVTRVVVSAADPDVKSRDVLGRLLADPNEWRMLSVAGGVVVFGWDDPDSAAGANPYAGWEVDVERLAFDPAVTEIAPPAGLPEPRQWWEALWKPAYPQRPAGRDEAAVLLRKAEFARPTAAFRHLSEWEVGQVAGVVGAAGGWTGLMGETDAAVRLTLFRPPLPAGSDPPPPHTVMTFALQQRFAADRGPVPVAPVYAAVRAARRAVAENPTDASSHHLLAQAYLLLVSSTAEQGWAGRVPQLLRIRQTQASAALNKAVTHNPRLARAHLELARLYRDIGCLDLAVHHLRTYRDLPPLWGGPSAADRGYKELTGELDGWAELLDARTKTYEKESAKSSVADRALLAVQLELGGLARELLLGSDVAAFGAKGTELEVDLLLRTGRPEDVLAWTTPEVRGSLGDRMFHWTRAQAHLAVGDYDAADQELREMVGPEGEPSDPADVGVEVAARVGKSVLDAQPSGGQLNQHVWHALSRADLQRLVSEVARTLGLHADMITLRGVMALEAGNIDRARAAYQSALVFSPDRRGWGHLEFNGRRIATDGLALIGDDRGQTGR